MTSLMAFCALTLAAFCVVPPNNRGSGDPWLLEHVHDDAAQGGGEHSGPGSGVVVVEFIVTSERGQGGGRTGGTCTASVF